MKILEVAEAVSRFRIIDIPVSRILIAAVIAFLFLTLRQLFTKAMVKLFKKRKGKSEATLTDQIIYVLEIPARFLFVVLGIIISIQVLNLSNDMEDFMSHILRSLIVFCIFWTVYRASDVASVFIKKHIKKSDASMDEVLITFISSGFRVIAVILGVTIIMQEWGFDVAGIVTGLGLGGLAFALAAKDTVANLFGSIMIMIDKPFAPGDWINTPQAEGCVEYIGFRSTRIRTFAQALVTIPNSLMSNEPITNWSRMGKRRVNFKVMVMHNSRTEQLKECIDRIRKMLVKHPGVHEETILVYLEKVGDAKMELLVYFYTKSTLWEEYLETQQDINFKILSIIEETGIPIAPKPNF